MNRIWLGVFVCKTWCAELNMMHLSKYVWYHDLNEKSCRHRLRFNASFLPPSSQRGFYSQVYRCPLSAFYQCSLMERTVVFLFYFLEAGTSKWAEILLLYKRAALPESKDGTTQVVKAYIVWMALKRLCLWNCNISMQRTDITQSNMEVDRIALKQRRVYHNVNLGRSVFL